MKKRWLIILLLFVFLVGTAFGAFAAGTIQIIVDGKKITTDVSPQIIQGRVLVPVRAVSENLGADVKWDSLNKQVLINTEVNIWNEAFEPWKDLNAYQATYVVNEYLALLQGAVWGGDLYGFPFLFSQRVRESVEPWNEVWQPSMSGQVGSSVCRLNFRVLDGHIIGEDAKGMPIYEIAARVQSYDPRAGEPAYTDWIKAYRVILEESPSEGGNVTAHWVIDGERKIKEVKMQSKDMPDFWHSF